ncbi:MAG: flippase-like domain-containing protein [Deltaproteobacteria bacterium]|nr:flippase-like domain-containing protein [Deltaproteobacteria bacterium]
MVTKGRTRRWLHWAQYALCLAAIAYLVHKVPWYTQVQLHDERGPHVRLLERQGDRLVVERDGRAVTVPVGEAYHVVVDGKRVPKVETGVRDVARSLNVGWALYAVLLFGPVLLLQSYRLVVMVAVQGVRLKLWNAVKLNLAGNFFNFALPGTTGGDLVKAYYLSYYTHRKTEVATTVFLDRVIGLLGLVGLAAGAMLVTGEAGGSGRLLTALGGVSLCVAGACVAIFSRRIRARLRLTKLAERLPGGRHLLRAGRATVALRSHKGRVASAFLLTLLLQGTCAVSAAVMAWALDMRGPGGALAQVWYFTAYVSIGFLIAAVPLTPQAVGVMEAAYIQFFTRGHWNTASQAVAFAFAVRLIQLVWALPGILVPLLGAHLPRGEELAAFEAGGREEPSAPGGE